jgi:LysM repeat protein
MQIARSQLSVRLILLLTAICMVFLLIGGTAGAEVEKPDPVSYVVQTGDTLWDIAARNAGPSEDIRRLVMDITVLSGVEGDVIFPGQVLLIPPD